MTCTSLSESTDNVVRGSMLWDMHIIFLSHPYDLLNLCNIDFYGKLCEKCKTQSS